MESSREMQDLRNDLRGGVEQLYRDGLDLFQAGSYELAREVLMEVEAIWPGYKLTQDYLETIDEQHITKPDSPDLDEEEGDDFTTRTITISDTLDFFEENN